MRRNAAYMLLLAGVLLLGGCCNKENTDPAFVASSDLGLRINGKTMFTFDPLTCQASFNRQRRQFRLSSDTMSDYVVATLSELPEQKGQIVSADLKWTTERDIKSKKVGGLKVVKMEENYLWLWSNADKLGLCLKTIESP